MAGISTAQKADLASLRIHEGQRRGRSTGKYIAIAVFVLMVLAGAIGMVLKLREGSATVETAVAVKPDVGPQTALNASGYVTPRRRATIAAKITGRVTSVHFDEGTRVAEGQLLATLDDSDAQRALAAAKADRDAAEAAIADYEVQLRNASIQLKRAQDLQAAGVQTQEALDNAKTTADSLRAKITLAKQQVSSAEARIGEAQQNVDNCIIRAPFAGIVVSKDAQVGEMVSPVSAGGGFTRTGIATIVDMNSNEVEVDVNEAYIARVQPGQKCKATLDAYPDAPYDAKVRTVIPTADRQKATVKVRVTFDKLDSKILPDMGVKVAFLDRELDAGKNAEKNKGPEALAFIPKGAVRTQGDSSFVFLVRDGKVERREVKLGTDRGTDVAVLAGVQPGAAVVVKGPEDLRDGQKIETHQ
jgi:RND family efflux transporter MFP subunit